MSWSRSYRVNIRRGSQIAYSVKCVFAGSIAVAVIVCLALQATIKYGGGCVRSPPLRVNVRLFDLILAHSLPSILGKSWRAMGSLQYVTWINCFRSEP